MRRPVHLDPGFRRGTWPAVSFGFLLYTADYFNGLPLPGQTRRPLRRALSPLLPRRHLTSYVPSPPSTGALLAQGEPEVPRVRAGRSIRAGTALLPALPPLVCPSLIRSRIIPYVACKFPARPAPILTRV
jgi:hypothetical protein